jgi:single-stranded DNA-specific DHH superfamily exonuclease
MSAIFRTVELAWDGKTYEVKPTMALLNKIEQRVSLLSLARSMATEAPPVSHMAFVIGEFLRAAGARVDDAEVYQELMTTEDGAAAMAMYNAIFAATFPTPKKKGEAAS